MIARALLLAATVVLLPASAGAYSFISTQGCERGKGAAWPARLMPSVWLLNENGYPNQHGLAFDEVRATIESGMQRWEEPCCSKYRSTYGGTTTEDAFASRGRAPHVVSFRMERWNDLGLGAGTIAVTMPEISGCEMIASDVLFNGVNFTYRTDGTGTDLESIATHEFGHWVGLGHTGVGRATMFPSYLGGISQRTLEEDDIAGVCALYTSTCEDCDEDADCDAGSTCVSGACRAVRCEETEGCPVGSACVDGTCRPGCRDDEECPDGEQCLNSVCRSDCSICRACITDADCGGPGYLCTDLGDGLRCTERCDSSEDCDGDSVCRTVDVRGARMQVCVAPMPTASLVCPIDYRCHLLEGCPGLWRGCDDCAKGSDTCLDWDGASVCSCNCESDEECGFAGACVDAGGSLACVPRKVLDPCWGVMCRDDQVCEDGRCVLEEPCARVRCPEGTECRDGLCWSPCGPCPNGTRCEWESETCVPYDACAELVCDEGLVCNPQLGRCEGPCDSVICGEGERCDAGTCVPGGSCRGLTCAAGERCESGSCVPGCEGDGCSKGSNAAPEKGCSAAGGDPGALLLGALALILISRRPRDRRVG